MSSDIETEFDMTELSPKRPSLVINAISNYAALGINVLVGLFLTPFIIDRVGKPGYGIWIFIGTFIGYYGLLNLGVTTAISRYIARYSGKRNLEALNKTASTAMAMFCCTGVLAIGVSFSLAGPLARYFEVPSQHYNDFRYMIWIMGLATGLGFPGNVFGSIVTAHERFVPANCVAIARTGVRAGLVVLLLFRGLGLIGIAYAVLGSQIVGLAANYFIYKIYVHDVELGMKYAGWAFLRKLLAYGGVTTVITIADHLRMNIDSFVIGKWVGMSEVGVYGIALILIRYMMSLIVTGMNVLTPRFAVLDGSNDLEKIKDLFEQSLRISAFLSFGCCMGAILFGKYFITLWVGNGFENSGVVLCILSVSFAFGLSQNPGIGLMYALNKHYFYAIATTIEAIANVILSIILVSRYGIIGVALGTAIPMIIVKLFVQPVYTSRIINIPILTYAKPIVPSVFVSFTIILLSRNIGIFRFDLCTISYLIYMVIITCVLYVCTSFLMMSKTNQKRLVDRLLTRKAISKIPNM